MSDAAAIRTSLTTRAALASVATAVFLLTGCGTAAREPAGVSALLW